VVDDFATIVVLFLQFTPSTLTPFAIMNGACLGSVVCRVLLDYFSFIRKQKLLPISVSLEKDAYYLF
jgi:hypothetical protein